MNTDPDGIGTDRNPKPDLTNESSREEGPGGTERKRRNVETSKRLNDHYLKPYFRRFTTEAPRTQRESMVRETYVKDERHYC